MCLFYYELEYRLFMWWRDLRLVKYSEKMVTCEQTTETTTTTEKILFDKILLKLLCNNK